MKCANWVPFKQSECLGPYAQNNTTRWTDILFKWWPNQIPSLSLTPPFDSRPPQLSFTRLILVHCLVDHCLRSSQRLHCSAAAGGAVSDSTAQYLSYGKSVVPLSWYDYHRLVGLSLVDIMWTYHVRDPNSPVYCYVLRVLIYNRFCRRPMRL